MSSEIVFFLHDPDLDVSYDDVIPMVETVDIYLERSVEDLHREENFEDEEEEEEISTEDHRNELWRNETMPEIKTEKPNDVSVVGTSEDKEISKETTCEPLLPVLTKSQENLDLKKETPTDDPAMADGNKDINKEIPKNEPLKTDCNEVIAREIMNELLDKLESPENMEISNSPDMIELPEKKKIISKFSRVRKFVSRLTRRKKVKKSVVKATVSNAHVTVSEVKFDQSTGPQTEGNTATAKADDDATGVHPNQGGAGEDADSRPQKSLSWRVLKGLLCCVRVR